MDPATVRAKMVSQVEQASRSAMAAAFGWTLDISDLIVHATLKPRRRPDVAYLLRITFDDFPRRAPSYVFVDATTRQMTDAAWPPGVRHGAEPPGICTPGTREFHEHYHRGDGQYPWDADRYTFLNSLAEINRLMERAFGA